MADGPQAQRAARLVDAPGLQLDGADPLGHRDQGARALTEAVEADREAAVGIAASRHEREQVVDIVAAHLGLADEVRDEAAVGRRVEQHAAGGLSVAPGAAGLLVVALERGRQRPVPDRAHVRLVDAHPERGRRHHDAVVGGHEARLARIALGRAESRVVGLGGEIGLAQALGDVLAAGARARVDDGRPLRGIGQPGGQQRQTRPLALDRCHVEGQVGAVDSRPHLDRVVQPQRAHDVGRHARRRRRRQRHRAACADCVTRIGEPQVVGAEVMPPFAQAVGLVDREERDLALLDGGAEAGVAEALGRHQHEPAGAVGERSQHRVGLTRGQRGVEHARRAMSRRCQRIALVAHQGDERRDHDRQPVESQARELVAERLARARGHHDERVASREGRLDGLLLPGAKRLVPEQAVQMCGRVHPGNLAAGVDAHPRGA